MPKRTPARGKNGRFKKGGGTKKRASNPSKKRTTRKTARRKPARRKANPGKDLAVAGVKVVPVVYSGIGVAVGAFLGGTVTSYADEMLIDKIPASARGIGWGVLGLGTMGAGVWAMDMWKNLPVAPFSIALAVPMFLRSYDAFRILKAPGSSETVMMQDQATGAMAPGQVDTQTGRVKRFAGRRVRNGVIQPGRVPGMEMGSQLLPGRVPGQEMNGTVQPGHVPGQEYGSRQPNFGSAYEYEDESGTGLLQ